MICAMIVECFTEHFHKMIWLPRCDKVMEWERTHNITKADLKKKPGERTPYYPNTDLILDGERYDAQRRKYISYKDQWDMALQEGRKMTKNYVQYGVKSFGKVKKGLKLISFNFFSFFTADE